MKKYSKTYTKTHSTQSALNGHVENIASRFGVFKIDGLTIQYKFPVSQKKVPTYVFNVVRWDRTGNKLLDKKTVSIRAVKKETALNRVKKKYPHPYFVELQSIK